MKTLKTWRKWKKQAVCSCNLSESSAIHNCHRVRRKSLIALSFREDSSTPAITHVAISVAFIVISSPIKMRWGHFSELLRSGEMSPCFTTIPVVQFCKPDFGWLFAPPPRQYYAPVLWRSLWILQKNMMHTAGINISFSHPKIASRAQVLCFFPSAHLRRPGI